VERGRAVAVRVFFADGEPLAHCAYEVFSPADPKVPQQEGRTDGHGNVAFVPDAPGKWRVKVVDAGGHGLDAVVDVGDLAPVAGAAAGGTTGAALVLRPLAGAAAIAAVFGALVFLRRRRAPP
jgi:nickel transport protein